MMATPDPIAAIMCRFESILRLTLCVVMPASEATSITKPVANEHLTLDRKIVEVEKLLGTNLEHSKGRPEYFALNSSSRGISGMISNFSDVTSTL